MNARDIILGSIRRSLGATGNEAPRRAEIEDRLARHPRGLIPPRAALKSKERVKLFRRLLESASGTVEELESPEQVPAAITACLRAKNLPQVIRHGKDVRLASIPWQSESQLEVTVGPSDGQQVVSVSYAFAAVAETGTLVLVSGPDNPTTLNFLSEHHIVLVDAAQIAGDYETVWDAIRKSYGTGRMPRTVNWITGPSRSADIEQVHLHGAHGPRTLHVLVIGNP